MSTPSLHECVRELHLDADQRKAPVFVIGAARSGTSMLGWALAEHENFGTSFEADFIVQLYGFGRLRRAYGKARVREDGWLQKNTVEFPEFCARLGEGLDALYRCRIADERWVDATPRHSLIALQLALLFPRARFVHLIRNGRDAVSSMIHSGFQAWSAKSFTLACMNWARYVRGSQRLAAASPDRVMTVRYEDLVNEPDSSWQRLFSFLNVEPSEAPSTFVATKKINSSFHADDSAGAATSKPVTWTPLQERIFRTSAGSLMTQLGYPLDHS